MRALACLALVSLLAACQSGGSPAETRPAAPVSVASGAPVYGKDLLQEPCVLVPRTASSVESGTMAPRDLYCGATTRPSGSIGFAPLGDEPIAGDPTAEYDRRWRASAYGRLLGRRLECPPAKSGETRSGLVYAIAACAAREGGWQYLLLASAVGGRLVIVDGIPAALPVLERGLTVLEADNADEEPDRTRLDSIAQRLGVELQLFSAEELNAYRELTEQARLRNSFNDFAGAEESWRRALDVQTRTLAPDHPGIGESLMNLALEVSNLGRHDEARGLIDRAEPLLRRNADPVVALRLSSYRAIIAANQRDFRQAQSFARAATEQGRELARRLGIDLTPATTDPARAAQAPTPFGSDVGLRGEVAYSRYLEAAVGARAGDFGAAQVAIVDALAMLDQNPSFPLWWRPLFLQIQGEVSAGLGGFGDAERQLAAAVQLRRQLFGDTAPVGRALMALGRMYVAASRPVDAVRAFRDGVAILTAQRQGEGQASGGRAGFRDDLNADRMLPFLESLDTLAATTPAQRNAIHAEMFEQSQNIRAGVVSSTIGQASARLAASDPAIAALVRDSQESARQRDLAKIELAAETARADDKRDRAREREIAEKLRRATQEAARLESELARAFPDFSKLTAPTATRVADVQRQLAPDEAVLSFVAGRGDAYGFLIMRDRVTAARLETSEEDITDRVRRLRQAFTIRDGRLQPFDLAGAHALWRLLAGPLDLPLERLRHLIVVPSGALLSFPPTLFVTEPASGADYRSAVWLGRRVGLSVAPSVAAFLSLRAARQRPSAPEPFIGFGDPTFAGARAASSDQPTGLAALGQECRTGGPVSPALIRGLDPLPDTADELRRVATALRADPSRVILGASASEPAIRQQPLDRYRVLYFATHGLLPGELKCQSQPGLALSPPNGDPASPAEDGLLDASEVATLRLNADLVALSACNTGGGGGRFGGEALSGLAEAFFYAGARSLLVSHWQVPSAETVGLMTGTFGRIAEAPEVGLADALRQSQAALLTSAGDGHPFFWAAFTLIGDGGAGARATRTAAAR